MLQPDVVFQIINAYQVIERELGSIGVEQVAQDIRDLNRLMVAIRREFGSPEAFVREIAARKNRG